VRKGGFAQAEDANVVVTPGSSTPIRVSLIEATVSNLRVIGSVTTGGAASSSITPVSSLGAATLAQRQVPSLQEVLPEIPGVTFGARGDTTDPYQYFTVRGASIETRVQIDGHPVSTGYGGRFDLSQIDPGVFGGIDVFKGAGIDGANAGESVFGTINLRTRDFTPNNAGDVKFGIDQYGAQFSSYDASGNLFDRRLSYVLNYNVDGIVGPEHGVEGWDVEPDANKPGYGLLIFRDSLSDNVLQRSELAKLRYRFSDTTSLTAGFVGFQGNQDPQGVAYGSSVGPITVEPTENVGGTIEYNAPYAQNLIGATVPGFIWYPGTLTSTSQPFFEGELRTALGNDTLLLRPYTGVITRFVDGNAEAAYPDAIYGTGWTKAANGSYQESFQSAYDEIEVDRLHGTTFTYLHPYGSDNFLNFTYDYHSQFTFDNLGYPQLAIYVAPTTAKTNDLSLSTVLNLAPKLKVALGDFETLWNLNYLQGSDASSLVSESRTTSHNDPHVGLNYRPSSNFALRASAGSGVSVPYASQVSGLPTVSNGNSGINTLQNLNPNLNPEVTVAYGLGADVVLPGRSKLSLDLYDDTIHNAFVYSTYSVPLTQTSTIPYSQVSEWLNGPLERNYGLELALASGNPYGFGYDGNLTLQRAYNSELSPSFYALAASTAINGAQINGIPYAQAHAELTYARKRDTFGAAFGADYSGANNSTNGPGLVTFFTTLQRDLGDLGTFRLSVSNLFDRGTGAPYGFAVYNGGFATPQLGPAPTGAGLAYSSIPQFLQSIPPLTVRFSITKRLGWN
jgi:outer membrane receptor protein involved in Fe transport